MSIREEFEKRERNFMSPFGCLSAETRGRDTEEKPCPVRTAFQLDRDRIVYSNAFRRLKQKTLFPDPGCLMDAFMDSMPTPANLHDEKLDAFFDRLQNIFADMDRIYGIAAAHYGFQCQGCEDNCCLTRFYHHTDLEYLFIRRGFDNLDPPGRSAIRAKAEEVCRQTKLADNKGLPVRLMCPLNNDGLCILYHYRPMICRLHGIPHELQKPGQPVIHGPGCGAFDERCSDKSYYRFDRTQFYCQIARLENEFKQAAGLTGKIKLTIAAMILEFGSRYAEVGK